MRLPIFLLIFLTIPGIAAMAIAAPLHAKNHLYRWIPCASAMGASSMVILPAAQNYRAFQQKRSFLQQSPENISYDPQKTLWANQVLSEHQALSSDRTLWVKTHDEKIAHAWGSYYDTAIIAPKKSHDREDETVQLLTHEARIENKHTLEMHKKRMLYIAATTLINVPFVYRSIQYPAVRLPRLLFNTALCATIPFYARYLVAEPALRSLTRNQKYREDRFAIDHMQDPERDAAKLEKHAAWLRHRDYWENTSIYALSELFPQRFVDFLYATLDTTRYKERAEIFKKAAQELRKKQALKNHDKK